MQCRKELGDVQRCNTKDIRGGLFTEAGGAGVKKSEWWSQEAAVAVREKREDFAKWLQKKR
jgi:hypothetical protein